VGSYDAVRTPSLILALSWLSQVNFDGTTNSSRSRCLKDLPRRVSGGASVLIPPKVRSNAEIRSHRCENEKRAHFFPQHFLSSSSSS